MREGWTYKKLGEVCETSSGGTPSKSHKEYYEGGTIPWLRSGEVSQGLIYNTEFYITDLGLEKSSAKSLEQTKKLTFLPIVLVSSLSLPASKTLIAVGLLSKT